MTKRDRLILVTITTVFLLFVLNYFFTVPIIKRSIAQAEQAEQLDAEILQLQEDIAQGQDLMQEIIAVDSRLQVLGLEYYSNENYSVHNRFVDIANAYGLSVSAIAIGEATPTEQNTQAASIEQIAEHRLVINQLSVQEIELIDSYYSIVKQPVTITVIGRVDRIIDYIDEMSREDVYTVMTAAEMDTVSMQSDITVALQFEQYRYILTPIQLDVNIV